MNHRKNRRRKSKGTGSYRKLVHSLGPLGKRSPEFRIRRFDLGIALGIGLGRTDQLRSIADQRLGYSRSKYIALADCMSTDRRLRHLRTDCTELVCCE